MNSIQGMINNHIALDRNQNEIINAVFLLYNGISEQIPFLEIAMMATDGMRNEIEFEKSRTENQVTALMMFGLRKEEEYVHGIILNYQRNQILI